MNPRIVVLLNVFALLVTLPLFAQTAERQRFKQFDKDGDGKLTREELPYPKVFRQLDRNGDGIVTRDEAARTRTLNPELGDDLRQWFTELDANRNRVIEPNELDNPRELHGADRNADGKVSFTEARRYFGDIQATLAWINTRLETFW